jgi:PKD repeat protein
MKKSIYTRMNRYMMQRLLLAVSFITLAIGQVTLAAAATTTLPVFWSAGGLSAGNTSVGNSSGIAADSAGNVAIVSGPAFARSLGVTSYTKDGVLRWQQSVSPAAGTFLGNRIAATPNGDFVAVGTNIDSSGHTIGVTIVRYASDGTLQWRVDSPGLILSVGRLVVDAEGNAYLSFNSNLHKYSPTGTQLWATYTSVPDSSAALSPDGADIVVTGASGGIWRTAAITTSTGTTRWLVNGAEGVSANDVIVDAGNVYVTGQGYTGASTPALTYYLTVVAYDRATGSRLWRTDTNAPTGTASGNRMAQAPDGSLVVAGRTSAGGYFDWFTVALNNTGSIKWQALRNQALSGDEVPASVFVRADGTTVVSGVSGPVTRDILGNSYLQGVTAGYDSTGTPQWEAFAKLPITGATPLPNGDICATGGYDALVTCWHVPAPPNYQPALTITPASGTAPLTVNFNESIISNPNGPTISYVYLSYADDSSLGVSGAINFGDGTSAFSLNRNSSHTYLLPGTYTANLTVFYTDGTSATTTGIITVNSSVTPAQPPLITATPSSGTAPLNVTLTSSATMAPNGPTISSFQLNFGDGTPTLNTVNTSSLPSFSSTFNHIYTAAGTYTATLTAFYSNATSASSSTTITVNPAITQPPAITATPSSGTAPLAVTFTSSASSANLLIGSYVVDYGDGTSNQFLINLGNGRPSFSATSSHTYTTPGVYTATLTVSYNNATTSSATTTISVNPVVAAPVARSTSVNLTATLQRSRVTASGSVTVKDANGAVIPGAVISANWTRPDGSTVTQTATTSSTGIARFSTSGNRGTYILKVTGISKTGYGFDSANSILSGSITR